jgi:hypothetical protein
VTKSLSPKSLAGNITIKYYIFVPLCSIDILYISANKTDHHDITEILLRGAAILIYTIKQMLNDYANNNINIGFIYQV